MRFIDLFAGLGGFHVALEKMGMDCVYASEKDAALADLYQRNFSLSPGGDLRDDWGKIPQHDMLCAGFPCQPFSKAGGQLGLNCDENGDLFSYVTRILAARKPHLAILENVPNLTRHNERKTWKSMEAQIRALDYDVRVAEFSPTDFGIPQNRIRTFVVCAFGQTSLENFRWPVREKNPTAITTILEPNSASRKVSDKHQSYIAIWQDFLDRYPKATPLPSYPIWAFEFGADYPLPEAGLGTLDSTALKGHFGSFGQALGDRSDLREAALPPYVNRSQAIPRWKRQFIEQNRALYRENKSWLDDWKRQLDDVPNSFKKFEWNWKGGPRDLSKTIMQFRASGLRAKAPTAAPSLVALTTSQVPIIGWEGRYLSVREGARLQSLDDLVYLPGSETAAFRALGNAVNSTVVERIARSLVQALKLDCHQEEEGQRLLVSSSW